MNEVLLVPLGGMVCWTREKLLVLGFSRERVADEVMLKESIEVAGDTPSDIYDCEGLP